jgi:hypothetical protein
MFLSIMHHYFLWHYSRAFVEIFHVWKNFLWFTLHFFSIGQLLRSWFAPWKRITEDRGETWNLEDLAGFLLIGLISRVIGFIIRSAVIFVGLVSLLVVFLGGITTYLFWIIAPVIIVGLFGAGVMTIIL